MIFIQLTTLIHVVGNIFLTIDVISLAVCLKSQLASMFRNPAACTGVKEIANFAFRRKPDYVVV